MTRQIVNLCITNKKKDKFLFLKRNKFPFIGYWGMPGGKVDPGEKIEGAASRELFEESGIRAKGEYLGVCHEEIIEDGEVIAELEINFFHFAIDENTSLSSGSEGEIRWIGLEDFEKEKLIPSDPLMIRHYFKGGNFEVRSVIEKNGENYSQKDFKICSEKNTVDKVKDYVKEVCDGLEHGDEWFNNHFSSVVKYSKALCIEKKADIEILEIAAWLHDIGSILIGRENHHITGMDLAEKKLIEFGYDEEKIEKVKHCIFAHRGSQNIKRESTEAEILADADSMSHFDELAGLFKYEFIISGINFRQREAQKNVRDKLERSYKKLSEYAKKIIKPRYDAAMLLLNGNGNNNFENKKLGVGVGVMVLNNGKVLLGLRHSDNKISKSVLGGEGCWTFPGGKVEFGESFEEAAIRETKEECNLDLKNVRVICINNDKTKNNHYVTIGLICENFSGEERVNEPNKIIEWKWFDLRELPKNLYFPTKKMIENYLNNKFYLEGEEV